ncbi:MAG: amidohydrolase family protein [Porcipelethomonas sp.]
MDKPIIKVFDAHTHVFPDKLAEKSKEAVRDFYRLPMYTKGTEAELEKSRNETLEYKGYTFRITGQLICSPAVTAPQTVGINRYIVSLTEKNDCFIGLGTLHPDNENYREIIDSIKSSGLHGIKFHSDFQQFNIDDKRMYPVYKYAAENDMPVLFHMGDKRLDYSLPERLRHVIEDIPELKVIAAHMGGYSHWDEAISLPVSENLYFDVSSALGMMPDDLFVKFIERFGYDHFFFGSDFPMWDPIDILHKLLSFDLGEKAMKAILYDNVARFFKL